MKYLLAVLTLSLSIPLFAHDENEMGSLQGDHLGLYYSNHAISGQVGGALVYATPTTGSFGITLMHRSRGKDFSSVFKMEGKGFIGTIQSLSAEDKATESKLTIESVKGGIISGHLDTDPFTVKVSADAMEDAHFVNPRFDVDVAGKAYRFDLQDGKACMGCITKIVYVVVGMLRSTGSL